MARAIALCLVLLLTTAAWAAAGEPWVDADKFKPGLPAQAPAPSSPKVSSPSGSADYGDQAAIERRRKARLAYTQALDEFNAGHYTKAARLFQLHLAVFPENGQARQYLATARRLERAQTHGTLKVLCQPRAQVLLDGKVRGLTPLSLPGLPVGPHLLQVENEGVQQGREVIIKPMTTTTVEFDLRPAQVHVEVVRPGKAAPEAAQAKPPAAAQPAPSPASPPAGTYTARAVSARFTPPPGWRVEENAANRWVKIRQPGNDTKLILVTLAVFNKPVPLASYVSAYGQNLLNSPKSQFKEKVSSREMMLQGRKVQQVVYRGKEVQAVTVFMDRGKRIYTFSAICAKTRCAALAKPFWTLVKSFGPLP